MVAVVLHRFVHGVARGAGDGRDDGAFRPVRAFSSVDLPTLGRPMIATLMSLLSAFRLFGSSSQGIRAVTWSSSRLHADAVLGRDGEDVRDSQRMELVDQDLARVRVDLIHRERDRFAEAF